MKFKRKRKEKVTHGKRKSERWKKKLQCKSYKQNQYNLFKNLQKKN